jgi:hypothetical protein
MSVEMKLIVFNKLQASTQIYVIIEKVVYVSPMQKRT